MKLTEEKKEQLKKLVQRKMKADKLHSDFTVKWDSELLDLLEKPEGCKISYMEIMEMML